MGFVYIFNVCVQQMRLSVNCVLSSPIGPPPRSSPTPYRPLSIQIARGNGQSGTFVSGQDNPVAVQFQGAQSDVAQVPVPAGSDDLWLYVSLQYLLLFDTQGAMQSRTP